MAILFRQQCHSLQAAVFMGSGFSAVPGPGMTVVVNSDERQW